MSVAWQTVLDGIHAHFASSMGIPVTWGRQPGMPERAGPAGTLQRFRGAVNPHSDSVVKVFEAKDTDDDEDYDKIRRYVTGQREFIIHAEVYSDAIAHADHAQSVLEKAVNAFSFPSRRDALASAKVAAIDVGQVIDLSEIAGSAWRSRAGVDIKFRTVMNAEDEPVRLITRVRKEIRLSHEPGDAAPILIETDTGDPDA